MSEKLVSMPTFAAWLAEDSVRISEKHEVYVVVVQHVLRTLEPVVSADEVVHPEQLIFTELVDYENIEHVCAAIIVVGVMCFACPPRRSSELPEEGLEDAEDKTNQSERRRLQRTSDNVHIFRRPQRTDKSSQISQLHRWRPISRPTSATSQHFVCSDLNL